jgi:MOSC domain-containing protein YiiM
MMQIESINVSKPVDIEFNGTSVTTGIFKRPIDGAVKITTLGLEGDTIVDESVHGGLDQAVYLYHKEDYDWWSQELGEPIAYGTFGENLTISGAEDISWVIGDRIIINDLVLEITAPRAPCFKLAVRMDDSGFVKKFAKAVRPGAYARVISEGVVQLGDKLTVEKAAKDYASVNEVFVLWHAKEKSTTLLQKALASPIAVVHREKLQAWYNER